MSVLPTYPSLLPHSITPAGVAAFSLVCSHVTPATHVLPFNAALVDDIFVDARNLEHL